MTGNPPGSKWRSTSRTDRKTKGIEIMLSAEARARLDVLAPGRTRSKFIEALIMAAPLPRTKK